MIYNLENHPLFLQCPWPMSGRATKVFRMPSGAWPANGKKNMSQKPCAVCKRKIGQPFFKLFLQVLVCVDQAILSLSFKSSAILGCPHFLICFMMFFIFSLYVLVFQKLFFISSLNFSLKGATEPERQELVVVFARLLHEESPTERKRRSWRKREDEIRMKSKWIDRMRKMRKWNVNDIDGMRRMEERREWKD